MLKNKTITGGLSPENQNGRIISAKPLNNIQIQDLPVITVTSKTGSGALIKPVIGRLPLTPQGDVVQVIDCISPRDGIVGYVNGEATMVLSTLCQMVLK